VNQPSRDNANCWGESRHGLMGNRLLHCPRSMRAAAGDLAEQRKLSLFLRDCRRGQHEKFASAASRTAGRFSSVRSHKQQDAFHRRHRRSVVRTHDGEWWWLKSNCRACKRLGRETTSGSNGSLRRKGVCDLTRKHCAYRRDRSRSKSRARGFADLGAAAPKDLRGAQGGLILPHGFHLRVVALGHKFVGWINDASPDVEPLYLVPEA